MVATEELKEAPASGSHVGTGRCKQGLLKLRTKGTLNILVFHSHLGLVRLFLNNFLGV